MCTPDHPESCILATVYCFSLPLDLLNATTQYHITQPDDSDMEEEKGTPLHSKLPVQFFPNLLTYYQHIQHHSKPMLN
jgi:hypothetical protein